MELKDFADHDLLTEIREKSKAEQKLTLYVVELIKEVSRRKLFLSLGFGSLFDFVTKDLGFEPASAMRRIQAARLVSEIPEVQEKLESGSLSLSVASQAQTFFRKEEQRLGAKMSVDQKTEILSQLENKSAREAERALVKISPMSVQVFEKQRALSEDLTEIKLVIDKDLKAKLDELMHLMSHQNPEQSYVELLKLLVTKAHKSLKAKTECKVSKPAVMEPAVMEPTVEYKKSKFVLKNLAAQNRQSAVTDKNLAQTRKALITSHSDVGSDPTNTVRSRMIVKKTTRYIPAAVKRYVWKRDQGCCQYLDPRSNRKCESKYQLQLDHLQRYRDWGQHNPENLRLLCANHNRVRG